MNQFNLFYFQAFPDTPGSQNCRSSLPNQDGRTSESQLKQHCSLSSMHKESIQLQITSNHIISIYT